MKHCPDILPLIPVSEARLLVVICLEECLRAVNGPRCFDSFEN